MDGGGKLRACECGGCSYAGAGAGSRRGWTVGARCTCEGGGISTCGGATAR
jgi:hypothetical protein